MGHSADKSVCPVVIAESDLLARSELKASVCAEVNEGIGFETVLCPKIGSEIEMWGNCIYSMRYFEFVISECRRWLWHDYHITKTKAGNAETTIFCG